jgi:hypothetical protein
MIAFVVLLTLAHVMRKRWDENPVAGHREPELVGAG